MNIWQFFIYAFLFYFPVFTTAMAASYESIRRTHEKKIEREEKREDYKSFKQNLHYEGAKNQLSIEVALEDFSNFTYPLSEEASSGEDKIDTLSFFLSYILYPLPRLKFGRIGIGGRIGVVGKNDFSQSYPFFITLGPKVSYAANFMVGQLIVPVVELGYEKVFNRIDSGSNSDIDAEDFNTTILGLGLLINLNQLDAHAAMDSMASSGIRKYYLSLMYQSRSGDKEGYGSGAYVAGIRFEF